MKVGCCGWSFFKKKRGFKSVLQSYASVFECVEINSTFYRIPMFKTVERWRREVDEVNKKFEFSVKCNRIVTHKLRFGRKAVKYFPVFRRICETLNSHVLLFQSPASFRPTKENVKRMRDFFDNIDRGCIVLLWESRGEWRKKPELVKEVCENFDLVDCVDPLRNKPVHFGKRKIAYFRLHGFGFPSMYSYTFSEKELEEVLRFCEKLRVKETWVMFNNSDMYGNAIEFSMMLKNRS